MDKPFINLESAANHPCQALAAWKTLDDFAIAPGRREVRPLLGVSPASSCHWRSRLRLRRWRRCAACKSSCCGRKGTRCRKQIMDKAARCRGARRGFDSPNEQTVRMRLRVQPSWGMPKNGGDFKRGLTAMRAADAPNPAPHAYRLVRAAGAGLRAPHSECRLMHCLPVRRDTAVAGRGTRRRPPSIVGNQEAANRLAVQMAPAASNAARRLGKETRA